MNLDSTVSDYIEEYQLLTPEQQVVVGVSGGADSICLLDILCNLGFQPIVAHLDHKLRSDSDEDAAYVDQIAADKGLEFIKGERDPRPLMAEGRSLEEAARLVRYRFFVRIANESRVNSIAVGHTSDDQVETVLMHLLRGAGPIGMRGMLPKTSMDIWNDIDSTNGISVIRPLLAVSREQTERYCQEKGYQPRVDPSNKDNSFLRNRIRNELLPLLEEYNPGVRKALLRTSKIMSRLSDLTNALLEDVEETLVVERGDEYVLLDRDAFVRLQDSLKWDFIYRSILSVSAESKGVDYEAVSRAFELLSGGDIARADLASGTEAFRFNKLGLIRRANERVSFSQWPQMRNPQRIPVKVGGQAVLNEFWALESFQKNISEIDIGNVLNNDDPRIAYVDANVLSQSLQVRPLIEGDRIRPLGMDGTVKVSDYFTNEKIPTLAREYWPLLLDGEEIVWILGLRQSNRHKVDEHTKEVVVFRLIEVRAENETEV
jgi:tRNA(Ile)-lysidine synthase